MEALFDQVSKNLQTLPLSSEKYEEVQAHLSILANYYQSDDWKQDYADDEAGLLPKYLKRGVLSQDGLWNLFSEWQEYARVYQEKSGQQYSNDILS